MKYKCIKDWKRVSKGTVVDEYEYRRFPQEIKQTHFVRVENITTAAPSKEDQSIVYQGPTQYIGSHDPTVTVTFTDPEQTSLPIVDIDNQSVIGELEENAKKLHRKFGNKKDTL